MKRREFIAGLGGAAAWPMAARGQANRRIGLLMGWSERNLQFRTGASAFLLELARLGWVDGGNLSVHQRWTNSDIDRARQFARELVAEQPDLIFAGSTPVTAALQRETRTIPIVFAVVSDPIGDGIVATLPRPGGNITGFIDLEASMMGKWLALLKEFAPDIKRAAIMFNPDTASGGGTYFLEPFETAARLMDIESSKFRVRSDAEIEAVIGSLDRQAGLLVMPEAFISVHLRTIIASTIRNGVPAIFGQQFARDGGLMSYGPDYEKIFVRAASYVDRILRGAKPAELPVQVPDKFELVINLRTAKAIGLTVPNSLLVGADEVIE